jgi:hypothetical protein
MTGVERSTDLTPRIKNESHPNCRAKALEIARAFEGDRKSAKVLAALVLYLRPELLRNALCPHEIDRW